MKIFLTIISIFIFSNSFSQQSVVDQLRTGFQQLDWSDIEKNIFDKNSDTYYPNLYMRFVAGDSTLNLNDFRLLYYGYSFQNEYKPTADNPKEKLALDFFHDNSEIMYSDKLIELLDYSLAALSQEPFNLEILNIVCYCYLQLKDDANFKKYKHSFNGLIEAIMSTGSGVDKERPWVVLYRDDVTDLISFLGGSVRHKFNITKDVEYFRLEEKISDVKGFYFDLSNVIRHAPAKDGSFKGFEFNPRYNPRSSSYINHAIK